MKGNILWVIRLSEAKKHDVTFLDDIEFEPGSFDNKDKAHIEFMIFYRQYAQRGKDADMYRDLRLRAGVENQERA